MLVIRNFIQLSRPLHWVICILIFINYTNSYAITFPKDTVIEISNRKVYIALPDRNEKVNEAPFSVLMAIHGNGRNAMSYASENDQSVPFYVHQRNMAIDNGYLFVVLSNGNETWGTDQGLENLMKVYRYISSNYRVKEKWVLWGTSAGGLQMFRMIAEYPEKIDRVIGTFPVYDLEQAYSQRKSSNFIWQSKEDFDDINPANFPEKLINVPMLIFHGKKDQAVPYKNHSLKLKREVNALGGAVKLKLVEGGHSTSNWKVYNNPLIKAFLTE
ncbi:alpha/beta hydrolase family protein [Cyclobacterium amurskyense]|uniref:Peptidase S9 prolyl oligopeptidase catalytic domain-containing protein n=1 Tax=Cyclobacterium amurskyense TaxID=320787 RepID=A0A0H4PEL9_9BACT|nr:prolyl oligopeptidase family serine peptidase [Cyclobacterium amurskyense]AKP52921.1 hypothetical protein CA2015_3541 [Cyclobacterium amurskyense]